MELASAMWVDGLNGIHSSAIFAVALFRGSTTMTLIPFFLACMTRAGGKRVGLDSRSNPT